MTQKLDDLTTDDFTQIYDEFCHLIYDLQDNRRQHQNYLNQMLVFDVEEKTNFPKLETWEIYNKYFENISNDHISVELIWNAIVQQVANIDEVSQKLSTDSSIRIDDSSDNYTVEISTLPLHWIHKNSLFYEYSNSLVYKFIKNFESSDFENFYKILNVTTTLIINSFIQKIPFDEVQDFFGHNEIFLELRSMESLVQVFADCIKDFQTLNRFKFDDDFEIIKFSKDKNEMFSMSKYECTLPTKVCFRDFMEYVWPEKSRWIDKEERVYDAKKHVEILLKRKGEMRKMFNENFLRNGSLKKPIADTDKEEQLQVNEIEVDLDDKSKLKSGNS